MATALDVVKKKKAAQRTTSYSDQSDDIGVLKKIAQEKGYKLEEDKPSLFSRSIDIISRPLYASAGAAKAVIKGENVAQEAYKGITGKEKETYSDVLAEMGVKNKWVKGGVGLGLDIALDPSTYFGGTAIKGTGKVIGGAGKILGKRYAKIAPESARLIAEGATKMKEGVTGAFSVYGGGRNKKIVDSAFTQLNKIAMEKENVIDDVVARFAKNVDEKKLERAGEYVYNNRLIERGIKEGEIKYPQNKETRELVESIKILGQDLAKKAGLKKGDKWYFPGIDETLLKKTSKEAAPIGVGKEAYLKQFKGKIDESKRLKDVREAYGRRMFDVVRDSMNRQFLEDTVSSYGFKKMNKKQALLEGYEAIKDKKFGKTLGYLKREDANFINNILYPEMKTVDNLAKGLGYDKVTNLFKTAVTAYFPAFHVRNALSGMVQNYQVLGARALAPANIMSGLAIMKGGETPMRFAKFSGTAADINKALSERFGGASRYISDIGDYIEELTANNFKVKRISNARKLGAFIEMNQKANATVTALRKGHTLDEALDLAEKAGFDYSKITKFESSIMKRLVPFYCVPDYSLALTCRGWMNVDELKIGEIILTYNTDKKEYEWQPVEDIAVFDHDEYLLSWSNKRHGLCFTNEHRWIIKTQNITAKRSYGKKEYKYKSIEKVVTGDELNKNHSFVCVSEYKKVGESMLNENEASLLGWLLADGYWRWKGNYCEAVIYQHPNKFIKEVTEVAGGKPRKPHPQSGTICVPVKKERLEKLKTILKRSKSLNNWIDVLYKLDRPALEAMYKAMYMADGTTKTGNFLACQLNGVAETFEVLSTLLGYRAVRNSRGFYVSKNRSLKVSSGEIKNSFYSGRVWCPRTKNGTWVMKQDKLITITGNTFARKNAQLQAETLLKNPERILNQAKLANALSNAFGEKLTEKDVQGLPKWALSGLGFKLKEGKYVSSLGLPLEEFIGRINDPIMSTLTSLNPIIKYPIESKMGYDFFRQSDIVDIDKVAPTTGKILMDAKKAGKLPAWFDNTINIQSYTSPYDGEQKYTMSPKALHLLRNLPTSRLQSTLEKVFDKDLDKVNKFMAFFTGGKVYDIDVATQKFFKDRDMKREMQDYLMNRGVGEKFESFYIKK